MKNLFFTLCFLLLTNSVYSLNLLELDKFSHFTTSGLISYSMIDIGFDYYDIYTVISVLSIAKESNDAYWDNEDILSAYLGMVFVFTLNTFISNNNLYVITEKNKVALSIKL